MNKNYEVLNDLIPKTQELHRAIFDKGYEQGQRDLLFEKGEASEQQSKPGHWVEYTQDRHRCSNCNKDAFFKWNAAKKDNVDILTDYCPNCGARMVELKESEDKE